MLFRSPPSYVDGGFDIFFVGYGSGLDWNPAGFYDASGRCDTRDCSNFINFDIYENLTDIAALVQAYLNELDYNKRLAIVKILQAEIYASEPVIPILYPKSHWGAREELNGVDYLLLSSSQQDWSSVTIDGFTSNKKNTESVSDDIRSSNVGSDMETTSTSLVKYPIEFILPFSFIIMIIINRRKTH